MQRIDAVVHNTLEQFADAMGLPVWLLQGYRGPAIDVEIREVPDAPAPLLLTWNGRLNAASWMSLEMLAQQSVSRATSSSRRSVLFGTPSAFNDLTFDELTKLKLPTPDYRVWPLLDFDLDRVYRAGPAVAYSNAAGGTSWATSTPEEVLADIKAAHARLLRDSIAPDKAHIPVRPLFTFEVSGDAAPESVCCPSWLRSIHRKKREG